MKINYLDIIKQAWKITWKNKYLWWFGMFISLSSVGSINYSANDNSNFWNNSPTQEKILEFIQNNLSWIIPAAVSMLVLYLLLMVLGVISRGALITSSDKLSDNKPDDFKSSFKKGKQYFWKLLFLGIVLGISILLVTVVIAIPIAFLFMKESYAVGILFAIAAAIILIPLFVLAFFLKNFGSIYIVLGKLSTMNAIESAYRLLRLNLSSSVILGLLFIPLGLVATLGTVFLIIPVILVFLIIGLVFYLFSGQIGAIVVSILGVFFILALILLINAIYQVLAQTIWVLFFKEIAKAKAQETIEEIEKEASVVPSPNPIP